MRYRRRTKNTAECPVFQGGPYFPNPCRTELLGTPLLFMIPESGTRYDFKACLLRAAAGLPVEGYSYVIPNHRDPMAVLAVSGYWVHIITLDLYTSTSYYMEAWLQHAEEGLIRRTDEPWHDLSETRKVMFI